MTNLDSILKSGDITLPTKVRVVKTTVFPVVMHGYESWTKKKADAFTSWCRRRLLRVAWTARRPNPSHLRKSTLNIHSLEGLMLKLQYFDHLKQKSRLIGKYPDAGKPPTQWT